MIQLGAVHHENPRHTFFGTLKPINENIDPKAMEYTGIPIADLQTYDDPKATMQRFLSWVKFCTKGSRAVFVSDTTAFDFSFVNWYLWEYCGENPFGHAPLSLNNVYRGLTGGVERGVHKLRKTAHTHNALDDAKGNQEAFVELEKMLYVQRINWKIGEAKKHATK
jgi:hypothetical protein